MRAFDAARRRIGTGWLSVVLAVVLAFGLAFGATPATARADGVKPAGAVGGTGIAGSVSVPSGTEWVGVDVSTVVDGVEEFVDSVPTYGSGDFSFASLTPGTYLVRFVSDAYRTTCYGGDTCTPVVVTAGQITQLGTVSLVLRDPGSITGRVRDTHNAVIPGATVTATWGDQVLTTTSDSAGQFGFAGIASGVGWNLVASKQGYTDATFWAYPEENTTVDVGTLRMFVPARVSGRVTGDGGVGIANTAVYLESTDDSGYWNRVTTDQDGNFTFTGIQPDRYWLWASGDGTYLGGYAPSGGSQNESDPVAVSEGSTKTVNVNLVRPAAISGVVKDASGAVVEAEVYLYEGSGDEYEYSTWSSKDGYSFGGLRPGRYTVRAVVTGEDVWLGGASIDDATWLTVGSGETSAGNDLKATLVPATVSGTILGHDGSPVQADVSLFNDEEWIGATSDANGHFEVAVHPGTYDVEVDRDGTTVCAPGYASECTAAAVVASAATTTTLNLTLPALGSLSGTVAGDGGTVVDWADISIEDANGNDIAYGAVDDGTGAYLLQNLPYGTYTLEVYTEDFLEYSRTVVIDGDATADIQLSSGHTISGTITLPGAESGDVFVKLIDPTTHTTISTYYLDDVSQASQPYEFDGLEDGTYLIGLGASDGRWLWYPDAAELADAQSVDVTGADVTGIDLTLPAGTPRATVSGHITLPAGVSGDSGYPDVTFTSLANEDDYYYATIDDSGNYQVKVPAGDYEVRIERASWLGTAESVEQLAVTGPMTHDLTVLAGASLTGRLADSDGIGVRGWVEALTGDQVFATAGTDHWGYWHLEGLPAGAITLRVFPDGSDMARTTFAGFTAVAGQTLDTGTQVIPSTGWLQVKIPEQGGKDYRVAVTVTDLDGNTLATKRIWSGNTASIPVRAGKVLMQFSGRAIKTEWWKDADSAAGATPVTVQAHRYASMITPQVAFADPVEPGMLSGTVTNETGKSGSITLTVRSASGHETGVDVASDGTYSVSLEPGDYTVRALVCTGYWMGQSGCMGQQVVAWYGGVDKASASVVSVESGRTTSGIDVAVGAKPAFTTSPKPTIAGNAVFGATLTAEPGTWTPTPDSFAYQWLRDGKAIDGATAAAYVIGTDDLDTAITVAVTATRVGYTSVTRTSEPTQKVAHATLTVGTPQITGTAKVGATLTAAAGTWGPGLVDLAYQWNRDGKAIDGATATTYLVDANDAGTRLSVTVTGSLTGYQQESRTSAQTTVVPGLTFTAAPTPSISGKAKVGSTLIAKVGTWAPSPDQLSYVWKRSGVAIDDASSSTYLLGPADAGKTITVTVTAKKVGYTLTSKTSKATSKVAKGSLTTVVPTVSGTAQVGEKLSVEAGTWAPEGVTLTYQWYRSGRSIKGATGSSYTLTGSDYKKKITAKVTGSALGYSSASKTSKATAKVIAGVLTLGTATISGTAQVGQKLTAVPANWAPQPVGYTYQWYRSGKAISKATKSAYTLAASDLDKTITVKVTVHKTGYTTASVTTEATDAVAPGTLTVGTPTISGTAKVGKTLAAKPGTWGPGTVSFTYQWLRNGDVIANATKSTYAATSADADAAITVKVTGKKTGYTAATAESVAVTVVA